MTIRMKLWVALLGISVGFVILFSLDMILNSGKFVAHAIHDQTPECSGSCHEPTEQISTARSAPRLVLPNL